jgi:chromate transporter
MNGILNLKEEQNRIFMKKYFSLFFTMLKIGLFTFGGGYAMIALLENEFVEKKKYIEKDEFLDMVAIAESTPGPIAINAATYIGYKHASVLGSAMATVGVCIPSLVIIYVISLFFDLFLSFTLVEYAFRGIQVCVIYLIFSAGFKMLNQMKKTAFSITIVCAVVLCMLVFSLFAVKFTTILYILICGCVGLFIYLLKQMKQKKEGTK